MKKAIYAFVMISLFSLSFMPALAATVTTGLTQDTSGGANPIVKAKWEMNIAREVSAPYGYLGTDDSVSAGAQFLPSGVKDQNKRITLCSIVTDPDGLSDVINVYADVFYPEGIDVGNNHIKLPSQNGSTGAGCGVLMQEDELSRLSKAEGIALFCNRIRNSNANLPVFASPYNYEEICKSDGELMKETAAVWCVEKDLSYEDPSGDYTVWAVPQDKVGLQGKLVNQFTYLPLTAIETDFTSINYGNVRLNTHKIINGDLQWGPSLATIRNVGNTRAEVSVLQDDMGFGQTGSSWNVEYDARIGSNASWAVYNPNTLTLLDDELDLSELDEVDFSINVKKFPPTHQGPYTGSLTLTAAGVEHLLCE